jgi:hypothetical protein
LYIDNKMSDLRAIAEAVDPPVPEELQPQVIPALESLEAAFRPLVQHIPPDTMLWTGPEDDA